jgi:hypothetical protein
VPPPSSSIAPYVTGGLSAAAFGMAVYFGIKAASLSSDYNRAPSATGIANAEEAATATDVAIGAGVVFGVATVVMLLWPPSEGRGKPVAAASARPSARASAPTSSALPFLLRF